MYILFPMIIYTCGIYCSPNPWRWLDTCSVSRTLACSISMQAHSILFDADNTDILGNEDQGYSGPYELYDNMIGGEPNDLLDFQNTDDSDDTSEETDDIDDTDVADYDIDDDIDNYDPDDQNIHDSDFDDLTDIYDNADNTLDDKEDESDQEPLSDHLSGLPVHEEVYNEEPGEPEYNEMRHGKT